MSMLQTLKDYLRFRKFIMPAALQFLFWAGIGGTLYGSWWLYSHDNGWWWVALVFGCLLTRLIFENFILKYQMYLQLNSIRMRLDTNPAGIGIKLDSTHG